MSALTAVRSTQQLPPEGPIPEIFNLPVAATKKIYAGGLTVINSSGYAQPGSTATGLIAVGMAEPMQNVAGTLSADNGSGSNGDISCVVRQGCFKWANSSAGDAITQQHAGLDCYIVDDQTVALTDGYGTRSRAGKIQQVDSDGVWVQMGIFGRDVVNQGGVISIPVTLAQIPASSGKLIDNFIPGFAGRIRSLSFLVGTAATTASKLATLAPSINPGGATAVDATGGSLALTSANMTPVGVVVNSSAVSAGGVFGAADGITIKTSGVTAFVEGAGVLLINLG